MSSNKSTNVRLERGLVRLVFRITGRLAPRLAARWAEALFFTPPRAQPSLRTRDFLASGRRFEVRMQGRRIVAWSWGEGPAVYLLHGWGGRGGQLAAFAPPLLHAGFSVVAVDAPGHGASEGRLSSLPEFARGLRAVVDATAPAHALVAHSLGAAAAVLALSDGLAAGRAVFLGPAADPTAYLRHFARELGLSPAVMEPLRRRSERRIGFRWSDLDVLFLARSMSAPLLVVHDREDGEVPWTEGVAMAEAWPNARLVTTTGLGHRKLLRDPAVVARVVSFVAGSDGVSNGIEGRCLDCGRPVGDWDEQGLRCASCSLETTLYQRQSRELGTC